MFMLIGQTKDRNSLLRTSLLPRLQHWHLGDSGRTETGKYGQNTVRYESRPFH